MTQNIDLEDDVFMTSLEVATAPYHMFSRNYNNMALSSAILFISHLNIIEMFALDQTLFEITMSSNLEVSYD